MALPTIDDLQQLIISGDIRALSKVASAIENRRHEGRKVLAALFGRTGRATIVGVTGAPGTGKSTLVDQFTKVLRSRGKTVGIIAVDPSSPFTGGAILGDRVRMQQHHADPGVYIRSMASRGRLGGVAQSTLELALLFDAAGLDVVLIETVGVGQDETEIARLADVTVLVLAPGFGDELQAMKAGIMEIADVFAINKADLDGADRLFESVKAAQGLGQRPSEKTALPEIHKVVATQADGVEELVSALTRADTQLRTTTRTLERWTFRLREMLKEAITQSIPEQELNRHAALVAAKAENPYQAILALRAYRSAL